MSTLMDKSAATMEEALQVIRDLRAVVDAHKTYLYWHFCECPGVIRYDEPPTLDTNRHLEDCQYREMVEETEGS